MAESAYTKGNAAWISWALNLFPKEVPVNPYDASTGDHLDWDTAFEDCEIYYYSTGI